MSKREWHAYYRQKIMASGWFSGALSKEQLIQAEIDTMFTELTSNDSDFSEILPTYEKYYQENNNLSDDITFSACLLFRDYEIPGTYKDVNKKDNYAVADGVWDKAQNAESDSDIPSICKRIIAAKVAYEEFGK